MDALRASLKRKGGNGAATDGSATEDPRRKAAVKRPVEKKLAKKVGEESRRPYSAQSRVSWIKILPGFADGAFARRHCNMRSAQMAQKTATSIQSQIFMRRKRWRLQKSRALALDGLQRLQKLTLQAMRDSASGPLSLAQSMATVRDAGDVGRSVRRRRPAGGAGRTLSA